MSPLKPHIHRVRRVLLLALAACLLPAGDASAREYASDAKPGIEEKLGETIPLDLEFRDEDGNPVSLRSLFKRPTILTLVYLRCPSICSPLMHEVARTVDRLDLEPGIDFDLITVSFDADEAQSLVKTSKKSLLDSMKRKVPPESWRFLTGDPVAITKLTDSVGFRFKKDKQDFVHAGTVIFLTKDGMIVRYLSGERILPFDMKLALVDAAEGNPRSVFQRLQALCYAYDTEGRTYVLQVNRIILFVTLTFLGAFLLFLVLKRKKTPAPAKTTETDPDASTEGTA